MPASLTNILTHVSELENEANAAVIQEFYQWLKENDKSEAYIKNQLKAITNFAQWLYKRDRTASFFSVDKREIILKYLETKQKSEDDDPDGRWIVTWNDYLNRVKLFYRWLFNYQMIDDKKRLPPSEWQTPDFLQIKNKKTQRVSPYSASEIWELEELQNIIRYEPHQRNKAAIMLMWDLNARNHEVLNICIKNIRLREQYAEGEIPRGKTGSGPILLSASFTYVRDWLNLHPLKDVPDARLICDLNTGKPLKSERLWFIMMQLKERIETMLKDGLIKDEREREELERLLREKKWNPYCLRHSSITHDSDYLPGYALNKKVRWTMTSKQPGRYIKNRMGASLRNTILEHNGIIVDENKKPRLTSRPCPKCDTVNSIENDYCSKKECGYPLTMKGFEDLKKRTETHNFSGVVDFIQSLLNEYATQDPLFADIAKKRKMVEKMQAFKNVAEHKDEN